MGGGLNPQTPLCVRPWVFAVVLFRWQVAAVESAEGELVVASVSSEREDLVAYVAGRPQHWLGLRQKALSTQMKSAEETARFSLVLSLYRVTTCPENLEMSGNLEHVREMSGMSLTVRELSGKCQGIILSWKSVPKLFITRWIFAFLSKTVHS